MKRHLLFLFLLFAFAPKTGLAQLPATHWFQYKTPEDAGISSQKLQKARDRAKRYNSANVLIIYKGAIVLTTVANSAVIPRGKQLNLRL